MENKPKEKVDLAHNGEVNVSFVHHSRYSFSRDDEKKADKQDDQIVPGDYGWFSFNPKWLQWANNATYFMVLMTLTNIFQSGTTNGLMGAAQSSIEKRFQLTSTQMSWIIIAYEIATIPLAILVTYIGTIGCHRPRWTTGFLFISCIGCFVYALPHFTTPVYLPSGDPSDKEDDMLCTTRNTTIQCEDGEENSSIQAYMAVFIIGRICLAFGGSGLYNFAVTYLDDSLTRDKFSLYTSMLALGGVVGPALGFILGGYLLSIYTDFPTIDSDDLDFDQNDPRWVGAWWLGYVIAGFGLIIVTLPMTGYPSDLPGAEEMRALKVNEAYGTAEDPSLTNLKFNFKLEDVVRFTKDIFTNWSFIWLTLYVCCDMAIISGFTVFGPKYAEVQFALTAAESGILFGVLVVPAGCAGAIAGGLLIERFKMSFSGIVKTEFFSSIVVFLMGLIVFLLYCKQISFAGVNIPYKNSNSSSLDLIDYCNENCNCESLAFDPICAHDQIQYFSPCHAGCQVVNITDDVKEYSDCECIVSTAPDNTPTATGGICTNSGCVTPLVIFSVTIFIAMAGLFMCEAMNVSSVIRVVPNSHRLFAMMCEGFIVRFLGTMPGPMIFGSAFDRACTLWQTNCDGSQGSCYYYDNSYLGFYMIATAGSLKLLSCVFMFLAWQMYKPPPATVEEIVVNGSTIKESKISNEKQQLTAIDFKNTEKQTNDIPNGTTRVNESQQEIKQNVSKDETENDQINVTHL